MPRRATFRAASDAAISRVEAHGYVVPTDQPESDGTFSWDRTTCVMAEVEANGVRGLGYTYADLSAATLIDGVLAPAVSGRAAMDVPGAWTAMQQAVRNLGQPGVCATAIPAVDSALWDLKGRLLHLPLALLLGRVHDERASR